MDASERTRLERELRERVQQSAQTDERMRSIVDHVIDGIITIDERGSVESLNPAAQRLFGYSAAEVLGQNVKLLMPEPYHSVLAEIKNDETLKRIPVVVLTTSQNEADIHKAYGLHANCYIVKPVDFEKFAEVVKNIENFWFTVVTLTGDH